MKKEDMENYKKECIKTLLDCFDEKIEKANNDLLDLCKDCIQENCDQ
jgi:hypothetical protein